MLFISIKEIKRRSIRDDYGGCMVKRHLIESPCLYNRGYLDHTKKWERAYLADSTFIQSHGESYSVGPHLNFGSSCLLDDVYIFFIY